MIVKTQLKEQKLARVFVKYVDFHLKEVNPFVSALRIRVPIVSTVSRTFI